MKRYVKADIFEDLSTDQTIPIWCLKVRQAIRDSGLSTMIEKYEEDSDPTYPCVNVTLKDPYVCRYYKRWADFVNFFMIAPNESDYLSKGSPEMIVVIPDEISDQHAIDKLKNFCNRIHS